MLTAASLLVAGCWVATALVLGRGWRHFEGIRRVAETSQEPENWPRVSVIVPARDEAPEVGETLSRLAALDYPRLEIILVNDRSTDATGEIAAAMARRVPHLRRIDISHLPEDWLGKTHALWEGYRSSRGEWLCFIDADVRLEGACLRRAVAVAIDRRLDHLTLFPALVFDGVFVGAFLLAFAFFFGAQIQPWKAKNPRSKKFCGVGAFNLIRREVYEAIGTHERLRLEVADDLKLGKLVKRAGFRQDAMDGDGLLRVRWQRGGLRAYVAGIEKNAFAGLDYSVGRVVLATVGVLGMSVFPFVALAVSRGAGQGAALVSIAMIALAYWPITRAHRKGWLYFLTHPLGALVLLWGIWKSTLGTLGRGGIVWRGTEYPLDRLRKYRV